jgi:hypothetical protein
MPSRPRAPAPRQKSLRRLVVLDERPTWRRRCGSALLTPGCASRTASTVEYKPGRLDDDPSNWLVSEAMGDRFSP